MFLLKKKMRAIALLVLGILVVQGCGNNSVEKNTESAEVNTASEKSTDNSQDKTTIKVWTSSRADQDYMLGVVDKYNKENTDGITIDYQMYTDNYIQTLDMAFGTGEAPDIIFDGMGAITKYVPTGNLEPLDQFLTDEYKSRYGDGAFVNTVNVFDGKIYTLPMIGSTMRLIYNQDIFERVGIKNPPKTLDEMVKDAKLITDKLSGEGIYGYAQNMQSPASAFSRSVDPIYERSGGNRSGYDFATGKYSFMGYKPILEAYKEIFTTGISFPGCESLDIDPLRTQFAAGKIGMYISYSHAEPGVYATQFPTTENWSVAQLPTIDGTVKGSQTLLGGTGWMMNSKSENKEKSWKVMEYLNSDNVLIGYQEAGKGMLTIPSLVAKAKTPDIVTKMPELAFTENDKIWPNLPLNVTPEGLDMYSVFQNIVYGVDGYTDIDKALADLDQRYNDAYQKGISDGTTEQVIFKNFDPMNPAASMK